MRPLLGHDHLQQGCHNQIAERFRYRDFPHFIETWVWKNQFLREYEDFTFIAAAVARSLASQGVIYAEVFYTPSDFARRGLAPAPLTEAIRRGPAGVPEVEVALVPDLCRDRGPEHAERSIDVLAELRSPERIGHGTRAVEDPALVEYLAAHRIPIELCPGSNLRTGAAASLGSHPVRRYFDLGIPVSINTDDPAMKCALRRSPRCTAACRPLSPAFRAPKKNIHQGA